MEKAFLNLSPAVTKNSLKTFWPDAETPPKQVLPRGTVSVAAQLFSPTAKIVAKVKIGCLARRAYAPADDGLCAILTKCVHRRGISLPNNKPASLYVDDANSRGDYE